MPLGLRLLCFMLGFSRAAVAKRGSKRHKPLIGQLCEESDSVDNFLLKSDRYTCAYVDEYTSRDEKSIELMDDGIKRKFIYGQSTSGRSYGPSTPAFPDVSTSTDASTTLTGIYQYYAARVSEETNAVLEGKGGAKAVGKSSDTKALAPVMCARSNDLIEYKISELRSRKGASTKPSECLSEADRLIARFGPEPSASQLSSRSLATKEARVIDEFANHVLKFVSSVRDLCMSLTRSSGPIADWVSQSADIRILEADLHSGDQRKQFYRDWIEKMLDYDEKTTKIINEAENKMEQYLIDLISKYKITGSNDICMSEKTAKELVCRIWPTKRGFHINVQQWAYFVDDMENIKQVCGYDHAINKCFSYVINSKEIEHSSDPLTSWYIAKMISYRQFALREFIYQGINGWREVLWHLSMIRGILQVLVEQMYNGCGYGIEAMYRYRKAWDRQCGPNLTSVEYVFLHLNANCRGSENTPINCAYYFGKIESAQKIFKHLYDTFSNQYTSSAFRAALSTRFVDKPLLDESVADFEDIMRKHLNISFNFKKRPCELFGNTFKEEYY